MQEQRKNSKHHHHGKSSEGHVDKDQIMASLLISAGETVLDAGCGNGYMTKVYALDPDPDTNDMHDAGQVDRYRSIFLYANL